MTTSSNVRRFMAAALTSVAAFGFAANANAMEFACYSREAAVAQMDNEGLFPMASYDHLFVNMASQFEVNPARIVLNQTLTRGHLLYINKAGQYCVDALVQSPSGGQVTLLNPRNREVNPRTFVAGSSADRYGGINYSINISAKSGEYVGFQGIVTKENGQTSWLTVFANANAKEEGVPVNPISLADAKTSTSMIFSDASGKNFAASEIVNFKLTPNGEVVAKAQASPAPVAALSATPH
ncbi:MAG: hypothetical protein KDJ50_02820 [Alphaproteobacteria bacterium]|nr:hypothetical protein [Alphaproteobacteria bacterium]